MATKIVCSQQFAVSNAEFIANCRLDTVNLVFQLMEFNKALHLYIKVKP